MGGMRCEGKSRSGADLVDLGLLVQSCACEELLGVRVLMQPQAVARAPHVRASVAEGRELLRVTAVARGVRRRAALLTHVRSAY